MIRLLAGLVLGVVGQLLFANWFLTINMALAGVRAPRIWVKRQASRRQGAFEDQLAEMIDLFVGALRAGHGFLQALNATSREISDPARKELMLMVDRINSGVGVVSALDELTTRIDSPDLRLFAAAVSIQRQTGGNLTEVLESLAETVRERHRIKAEVSALTVGPRMSGYVWGFLPLALLAYFALARTEYREQMLGTTLGKGMLIFAGFWSLLGFLVSQRLAKVEY